jgi:tetratricopeptide (TPR) repeat protein
MILRRARYLVIAATIFVASAASVANAQHSSDIQKLHSEGEYFKALSMYELLPRKKVTDDGKIAAAKSAWALGLNRQAAEQIDEILRGGQIGQDTRVRLVLSRGVIEYQDERYQEAALFAQKAIGTMTEPSPLRGRAYLLWGQSLFRVGLYGEARERFVSALNDARGSDKGEANFSLGLAEVKLNRYEDAQKHLEAIPVDHERTGAAIRLLADIAIETRQEVKAKFWIEKGRAEHPDSFVDSWADYALLQVALAKGDLDEARRLTDAAQRSFAPSDPWIILMLATVEQAEWKKRNEAKVG